MTWHSQSCEPSKVRQLSSKVRLRTVVSQGDLELLSSLTILNSIIPPFVIYLAFAAQSLIMATQSFHDSISYVYRGSSFHYRMAGLAAPMNAVFDMNLYIPSGGPDFASWDLFPFYSPPPLCILIPFYRFLFCKKNKDPSRSSYHL